MVRSVSSLFASSLFLLLFAACGDPDATREGTLQLGRATVEDSLMRSVAPGTRTLSFEGFNGSIVLEGRGGETADLVFVKQARGDDADEARELLEEIVIEESGDAEAYRYVMQSNAASLTEVTVRGHVPASASLRIVLASGTVQIDGVDGPLRIDLSNGTVQVHGARSTVDVVVENGSIDIGMASLPPDGTVRLQTSNGNVAMAMPADASTRVAAETNVGNIEVQGLAFERRSFEPEGAGAEFGGTLGRGRSSVTVEVGTGNIVFREATPAAQPAPAGPQRSDPAAI